MLRRGMFALERGAEPYIPPPVRASSQLQSVSKAYSPAATTLAPRQPLGPPTAQQLRNRGRSRTPTRQELPRGDGEDAGTRSDIAGTASAVHALARAAAQRGDGAAGCSSSGGVQTIVATGPSTVSVPFRDMQLVSVSLERAAFAATKGKDLMQHLATQFETEAAVINQAKDVVNSIIQENRPTGM